MNDHEMKRVNDEKLAQASGGPEDRLHRQTRRYPHQDRQLLGRIGAGSGELERYQKPGSHLRGPDPGNLQGIKKMPEPQSWFRHLFMSSRSFQHFSQGSSRSSRRRASGRRNAPVPHPVPTWDSLCRKRCAWGRRARSPCARHHRR